METHKLPRHIGLIALTLYGIGDILGAGIYGLVGKAAGQMGYAVWLAFFVSMLAAGFSGLSYASLASRYPRAGGASYNTYRAFGSPFLSYLVGLAILASGLTSMATAAKVFAGYLNGFGLPIPVPVIAVGFALVIALVVFWGIKESLAANGLCTIVEVGGLLLVLAAGASFLGSANYLDAVTPANPSGDLGLSLVLGGAVLTFYSFVGFEDMVNVAEEVKEPRRTMPRALLLAVFVSSLIYMGVSLVAVSVISPVDLAASNQPLVDVVAKAAPWFPVKVFGVIALFAVANTALLNFIMGSRLLFGMAKQGLVPSALGRVHAGRRTPYIAVLAVLAVFLLLIVSGDISSLAKSTSVLLLSCFVAVNLSLVSLKRRETIPGSFEVPYLVPILGTVICLAILAKAQSAELITAGSILLVIALVYAVMRPKAKAIEEMDEAV